MGRYWQYNLLFLINTKQVKQNRCADLVIQVARLDKARLCHDGSWVKTDKITDLNPQGTSFFFIGYFASKRTSILSCVRSAVPASLVDMARSLVDEDGS